MAENVWRHPLLSQARAFRPRRFRMFRYDVLNTIGTQLGSASAGKQPVALAAPWLFQPGFQDPNGTFCKRRAPFFPALANDSYMRPGLQA